MLRKWYEDWGVWLVAVASLIGLGLLLGHDITRYAGAASVASDIGTLLVGVAAVMAILAWRSQEVRKFRAERAFAIYIVLNRARYDFLMPAFDMVLSGELHSQVKAEHRLEIEVAAVTQKNQLDELVLKLHHALKEEVLPVAHLLELDGNKILDAMRKADGIIGSEALKIQEADFKELKNCVDSIMSGIAEKALLRA